jgi:hypothetical protein
MNTRIDFFNTPRPFDGTPVTSRTLVSAIGLTLGGHFDRKARRQPNGPVEKEHFGEYGFGLIFCGRLGL